MKVKELIEELQELNPNAEVCVAHVDWIVKTVDFKNPEKVILK